MMYQTNNFPIVIFNAIEELANLSKATNLEKSQQQTMNYGLELLRRNGQFKTSLTTWVKKSPSDPTWLNFKKHFMEAHPDLIKVLGATQDQTPPHQTNEALNKLTILVNALTASYEKIGFYIGQSLNHCGVV